MSKLYLTEIFPSIQGETTKTGLPTVFIRLSGCHLRCSWCDTDYSFKRGTPYTIDDIVKQTIGYKIQDICVTGGEPLLQPGVYPLMESLLDTGLHVSLETSGACTTANVDPRVQVILDVKCPGSGMADKHDMSNFSRLRLRDEIKFVLQNRKDYEYALSICRRFNLFEKPNEILFAPSFEELDPQTLVSWILEDHLPVRINLQVHKWIWDPKQQGV